MKKTIVFLLFSLFSLCLFSQHPNNEKIKVFIDCSRIGCDRSYIISEINLVDIVVERLVADVHVLITAQRAGGGGSGYQLIFYGQNDFRGKVDTLTFPTTAIATDAEVRETMVQYIKLGLVPYLSKTPYAADVVLDMKGNNKGRTAAGSTKDKWNYWVFRLGANGEFNGEQVYTSSRFSSDVSASRVTERLRAEIYVYGSKRRSKYEYSSGSNSTTEIEVENSDYGIYHNIVRAFNAHWSYGYQTNFTNNTFTNYRRRMYFNPAIEYNIYPYKEVNNRFFVIRYGLDVTQNRYYDTTIYNKLQETLYGHRFSIVLNMNQRWGTFNSGVYYRNYFNDWSIRSMGMNINLEARITGGLSFSIHASGGIIRDQVYLKKGGATEQEILTRRRQLASSYNYRSSFGLNYRFGSVLNNFVNPRFQGGYGGF